MGLNDCRNKRTTGWETPWRTIGKLLVVTLAMAGGWRARAQRLAVGTAVGDRGKPAAEGLQGKVLVGYQGWFRCPGDGSPANAWSHWSRGNAPSAETMSVDVYPDTSELSTKSLCPLTTESVHGDPGILFSSFPRETVEKHFEWMRQYGIDGALLQRFVSDIPGDRREGDTVLKNVLASAESQHRVFAVEYDVSGAHSDRVLQQLQLDWTYLTDTVHVANSPAYLRMNGKPVVSIWGFGFNDGSHIDDPKLALEIIRWFQQNAHVVLMGGVPAGWGSLRADSVSDPDWAKVYAAFDIVQPWTVGRYGNIRDADTWKQTHLMPDVKLATSQGQSYMPVIFPGFSWHNLNRNKPENQIPRLNGAFLWTQAYNARMAGATMVKIAMFDEVNEGTAILKAASSREEAPQPGYWLTLDADGARLPNDWYLQIAGEIGKMFRGKIAPQSSLPIKPKQIVAEHR